MEQLFTSDRMCKRERVEAALCHQPLDRVPILEQLSYNPRVIAEWTGKAIAGFDYTREDVCTVIRQTCDLVMPPTAPSGTERVTTPDGFVLQRDNWTTWHVSRPFQDEHGACGWLRQRIHGLHDTAFDAEHARQVYHTSMRELQQQVGETVILNYSGTGFCRIYDAMGLEIFTFFM